MWIIIYTTLFAYRRPNPRTHIVFLAVLAGHQYLDLLLFCVVVAPLSNNDIKIHAGIPQSCGDKKPRLYYFIDLLFSPSDDDLLAIVYILDWP